MVWRRPRILVVLIFRVLVLLPSLLRQILLRRRCRFRRLLRLRRILLLRPGQGV